MSLPTLLTNSKDIDVLNTAIVNSMPVVMLTKMFYDNFYEREEKSGVIVIGSLDNLIPREDNSITVATEAHLRSFC